MIDINELALEVGKMLDERDKTVIEGVVTTTPSTLENQLVGATEVQRRFTNFLNCNPGLAFLSVVDGMVVQLMASLIVYGFHIGREYGKAELVRETLKGMEGGE